jgi:hypothetical protein
MRCVAMRYPGREVLQLYRWNCLLGQDRVIVVSTYIGGSAKVMHECGVVRQQLKTAFQTINQATGLRLLWFNVSIVPLQPKASGR